MSLDIAAARRRTVTMAVVNALAALVALCAIVGYFKLHITGMLFVFVAALLAGFGAQIWFIAGLRRPGKGA